MRKSLIIILFALSFAAQGQYSELGFYGGGTNFIGDVGYSGINIPKGWVAGINYRYQFNYHYSIRISGSYGLVAADDAESTWPSRQERNLSFRSNLWEGALILEINFLEYMTGSKKRKHSPYIFAGIGLFGFNPQGQYTDGKWYDLQPLSTEGQGTNLNSKGSYGLSGLSLPMGIGYRASIGRNASIAIEMGFRTTSTDYLDDVSEKYVNTAELAKIKGDIAAYFADRSLSATDKTGYARGNNLTNDWYVFTGIHLYFALTAKNERCSGF